MAMGLSDTKVCHGMRNFTLLCFLSLVFSGCSIFYYGYTSDEWNSLSEETKLEVKKEYQRVLEAKKAQEEDGVIEKRNESFADYGITKSRP